jgi:hypothetical protein
LARRGCSDIASCCVLLRRRWRLIVSGSVLTGWTGTGSATPPVDRKWDARVDSLAGFAYAGLNFTAAAMRLPSPTRTIHGPVIGFAPSYVFPMTGLRPKSSISERNPREYR